MSDATLDERVAELVEQQSGLNKLKPQLVQDISDGLYARIIHLYEVRGDEYAEAWKDFGVWLCAHFDYDYFSVRCLTREDPELKRLIDLLEQVDGSTGRVRASDIINQRLGEAGHTIGLDSRLTDVMSLRNKSALA